MTKRSDIEMVAKARAWAIKAHAGQKDKAGNNARKQAAQTEPKAPDKRPREPERS